MSSVACPALQYFPTLPHKRHDFRGGGGVTELKICVFIPSKNLLATFLTLKRNERDMVIYVRTSSYAVVFLNLCETAVR